jgi:hypothetical protein
MNSSINEEIKDFGREVDTMAGEIITFLSTGVDTNADLDRKCGALCIRLRTMTEWVKTSGLGPAWLEALEGLGEEVREYETLVEGISTGPAEESAKGSI